jgi:hypothetical protein
MSSCWMDVVTYLRIIIPEEAECSSLQGYGVMRLLAHGGMSARAWMV